MRLNFIFRASSRGRYAVCSAMTHFLHYQQWLPKKAWWPWNCYFVIFVISNLFLTIYKKKVVFTCMMLTAAIFRFVNDITKTELGSIYCVYLMIEIWRRSFWGTSQTTFCIFFLKIRYKHISLRDLWLKKKMICQCLISSEYDPTEGNTVWFWIFAMLASHGKYLLLCVLWV